MAHRNYTDEERNEAVRLIVMEGKTVTSVARELGVGIGTVQRWVSDAVTDGTSSQQLSMLSLPRDQAPQPHKYTDGEITQTKTEHALLPVAFSASNILQTDELLDRIAALEARLDQMVQAQKVLILQYLELLEK